MRTGTLADLVGNNKVSNEGVTTNSSQFFTTLLSSHDNADVANDDVMSRLLSEAPPSQVNNDNNVAQVDVPIMIPDAQQQQQHDNVPFENVDDGIEIVFDQGTLSQQQQQHFVVGDWINNTTTTSPIVFDQGTSSQQQQQQQFVVGDWNNTTTSPIVFDQGTSSRQQFVIGDWTTSPFVFDQGTLSQQQQQFVVGDWNNNTTTTSPIVFDQGTSSQQQQQLVVDDWNNNNTTTLDEHQRASEYLRSLEEFPAFSCAHTCHLLREIVLVERGTTCKFQIHGTIGLIDHAVYRKCHRSKNELQFKGNEYKIEMANQSFVEIKAQIREFLQARKEENFVLLEDALASFYETLSIGYDWVGLTTHNNPYASEPAGTSGTSAEGAPRRKLRMDKLLAKEISSRRSLIAALQTDILTALTEGQRKLYASGIAKYQKQIDDIIDGNLDVINRIMSKKRRKYQTFKA